MLKIATLAIVAAFALPGAAVAEQLYSQADADACTPDAMRLCGDKIPDTGRIAQCLVEKRSQLSPACHAVFVKVSARYSRTHAATIRETRN